MYLYYRTLREPKQYDAAAAAATIRNVPGELLLRGQSYREFEYPSAKRGFGWFAAELQSKHGIDTSASVSATAANALLRV